MRFLIVLMALLSCLLSTVAIGQETGRLALSVFVSDSPAEIQVFIGETKYSPASFQLITLPAGEHKLFISAGEQLTQETKIIIAPGAVSQVIATVTMSGISLDQESPNLKQVPLTQDVSSAKNVRIHGLVMDASTSQPVANASIFVRGLDLEGQSKADGRFEIFVPEGNYSLSIVHSRYAALTINQVVAGSGEEVRTELSPSSVSMSDHIVLAPNMKGTTAALLDARYKSSAVAEVLGAEQIAKAGDGNAGSALKRVTGLSLVGGKYVYVRGLGERYSAILLNSANIPSPDPTRKVIPLDIFPSSIIESVTVQKSYAADLPADFAGGTIKITTKSIPEKYFLNTGVSLSYIPGDTYSEGYSYDGGARDFTGFDDGKRALPGVVRDGKKDQRKVIRANPVLPEGYTQEEMEAIGESFPNIYNLQSRRLPPGYSLNLSMGDRHRLFGTKFGYIAALSYGDKWSNDERAKATYNRISSQSTQLATDTTYAYKETTRDIDASAMLNLGIELFNRVELSSKSILLRKSSDEAKSYEGYRSSSNANIRFNELRWQERSLFSQEYKLAHYLNPNKRGSMGSLRYTRSHARRYEPDFREYAYEQDEGEWRYTDTPWGFARSYSDLYDRADDYGYDAKIVLPSWTSKEIELKAGIGLINKRRNSEVLRFGFTRLGDASEFYSSSPEQIFTPENIGPLFEIRDITQNTDNYAATQSMRHLYGQLEIPVMKPLTLVWGARKESSQQEVSTFALFSKDQIPIVSKLDSSHILPAYGMNVHFSDQVAVKMSYSETLNRPDFKELSPAPFIDDERGEKVIGNPNLKIARITNRDIRLEYFANASQNYSIGLFHKKFIDPIEKFTQVGTEGSISFSNTKSATNHGYELDFRQRLPLTSDAYGSFHLAGNYARIFSLVKQDESVNSLDSEKIRPLQGQSPYVANLQFEYESGTSDHIPLALQKVELNLLYNVFGERITKTGQSGVPSEYELPYQYLDLVAKKELSKALTLNFKIRDLLAKNGISKQGEETTQIVKHSPEYTIGLAGKF